MNESTGSRFGAIEAGGTKFVCAIATDARRDSIVDRVVIPTRAPGETLPAVVEFLRAHVDANGPLDAVGIGSFGPLDLAPGSSTRGHFTTTPKPGWAGVDLVGALSSMRAPIGLDTDVNAAAYAESRATGGEPVDRLVYITVGTGIGGGLVIDGRTMTGRAHPEMGHVVVERHPDDDFAGVCPRHGDCVEGMASGPAIAARFGTPAQELGERTPEAVELIAFYLAQAVSTAALVASPEVIVMGGGVLQLPGLLDRVRAATLERLAGALTHVDPATIDEFVRPPALGVDAGIVGAIELAALAALAQPPAWLPTWRPA